MLLHSNITSEVDCLPLFLCGACGYAITYSSSSTWFLLKYHVTFTAGLATSAGAWFNGDYIYCLLGANTGNESFLLLFYIARCLVRNMWFVIHHPQWCIWSALLNGIRIRFFYSCIVLHFLLLCEEHVLWCVCSVILMQSDSSSSCLQPSNSRGRSNTIHKAVSFF